jgi:hypothetical protein
MKKQMLLLLGLVVLNFRALSSTEMAKENVVAKRLYVDTKDANNKTDGCYSVCEKVNKTFTGGWKQQQPQQKKRYTKYKNSVCECQ